MIYDIHMSHDTCVPTKGTYGQSCCLGISFIAQVLQFTYRPFWRIAITV